MQCKRRFPAECFGLQRTIEGNEEEIEANRTMFTSNDEISAKDFDLFNSKVTLTLLPACA